MFLKQRVHIFIWSRFQALNKTANNSIIYKQLVKQQSYYNKDGHMQKIAPY